MLIVPTPCHKNHLAHNRFFFSPARLFCPILVPENPLTIYIQNTPLPFPSQYPYPFSWSVNLNWGGGVDCGATQNVLQPSGEVIDEHIHTYCIQMHTIGEEVLGGNGRVFQYCPALCDANWSCAAFESFPVLFSCGWVSCNPPVSARKRVGPDEQYKRKPSTQIQNGLT